MAYGIVLAVSALNLLLVLGTMIWFNPVPVFGIPAVYKLVLGLGVVAAVLSLGLLVYILPVWRLRYWGLPTRIHYTAVTVAAVAFVWFLNYWKLLGWRYHPQ